MEHILYLLLACTSKNYLQEHTQYVHVNNNKMIMYRHIPLNDQLTMVI